MPAAARRIPWASQPSASAVVSRASPLARGLVLFAPGSQMASAAVIDLQQLANGAFRSGSGPIVVHGGQAVSFDGAFDSGGINWGTSASLKSDAFTWTGIFHFTSFSTPYCPIFYWETPTDAYTLFVKNDGKLASYCTRAGAGTFYDGIGAYTIQLGVTYRLTLTGSPNYAFRAYVNGMLDGATNVSVGGFQDTSGTVWIGHEDANINRKWAGWARDFAYWNRELSAAEIAELNARPWQLFAATRRVIVVPAAGGTTIAGGIGTATASGLQASIAIKTAIAGGIGTATASGLQASIALRTNIAAGIGTASASGLQASIALPTAIAAGIGTATASGLQATITVGSGITISGGIGTATASGLQAAISAQTTIQGGIGTATASGLQATIGLRTPISGGIGTATASGLQATLTFPTSIAAGIGDATASGLPAGITFPAGGTIIFGVGSATASGLQALIREIGVSGGASVRGKKRGWANERAALEESLRQVDRIAQVMAESDEPQAQEIAEELEDYSGEVEQIQILREKLQVLQEAQRRKELTAQKERDVQEAARELKAILDDDEEIAEVFDSMLHIEFRALRMIGVM